MKRRCGTTVIELVTLVAAVSVLLVLLLPAIQVSRQDARRIQCANHLKQFGLGVHNYHDTFKVIPPAGTSKAGEHRPLISWQVRILPFTEQVPLYDRINMRAADAVASIIPKEGEPNALAESHQVPYARCPDDEGDSESLGWSAMGTEEAGLRIEKGGKSKLAAQGSYCGNLGAQLTSPEANSRATECDHYNKPSERDEAGNFEREHGAAAWGFVGQDIALNNVETPNPSDDLPINQLSGIFSENAFGPMSLAHIRDGTSNTFLAGEVLTNCTGDKTRYGWWHYQDYTNARASASVPLNTFTTCVTSQADAEKKGYLHPICAAIAHSMSPAEQATASNMTWGFRSRHPGGANMLICDGSVQFINEDISNTIYQAYGGRDDRRPIVE